MQLGPHIELSPTNKTELAAAFNEHGIHYATEEEFIKVYESANRPCKRHSGRVSIQLGDEGIDYYLVRGTIKYLNYAQLYGFKHCFVHVSIFFDEYGIDVYLW